MHSDSEFLPTAKLKELFNAPDEKSAVKVMCRQVLMALNLNTAPIPLKPICQKFKLKVTYNTVIKREDSFLKLAPDGFEIELSKQKNWRRNRFTIAHELIHLMIFRLINSPINSFDRKQHDMIERLCDIGASELLINEDELAKSLQEYGISSDGLKFIYDKFMVSYDALFLKLSDLLNSNVLIWKRYARSISDSKEFRVYRHFPQYKYSSKSTWLPNGCTTKHIDPIPFNDLTESKTTIFIDDFKIIMNDKVTECSALAFRFPQSRSLKNSLPMFDHLTVTDELTYNECIVMFVFTDKNKLSKLKSTYFRNIS